MPLLDHFRPPLSERRQPESFLLCWACAIAGLLNQRVLPAEHLAEIHRENHGGDDLDNDAWKPPGSRVTLPATYAHGPEVQVFSTGGGLTLIGVVALATPANKVCPDARRAFATRCATYLHSRIGLVVIDVVPEPSCNLHDSLIDLLELPPECRYQTPTAMYVVTYRPRRLTAGPQIETWMTPLTLGAALPTVPLALRDSVVVPLDLDTTYVAMCADCRLV